MRSPQRTQGNINEYASASSAVKKIEWAEMKFPPINLWVLASSSVFHSHRREDTHNHRPQRPGMRKIHANSLKHFRHIQMQHILAMRGGTNGY